MLSKARRNGIRRVAEEDFAAYPAVAAFDPGGTTGWSIMMTHPEALVSADVSVLENMEHWSHGEIHCDAFDPNARNGKGGRVYDPAAEREGVRQMVSIAEAWTGAALVVEDFVLDTRNAARDVLSPVRIIAMFEYAVEEKFGGIVHRQSRVEKATANDARLKSWGLYEKAGGMGHARDGDRHAISVLRKAKGSRRYRHLLWPHIYDKNGLLIDAY